MTAIKFENFMGLIPRQSDRLLPPMAATAARNTNLLSGEAKGFRAPAEIADFTAQPFTVRRAYRIPNENYAYAYGEDLWLTFSSRDVDVVRSLIVNDQYDRYYWAGDGEPKYNTLERIANGDDEYLLGVPNPTTEPTVTPPAGSDYVRAYVYTFVSEFGEESGPSPPTLATGNAGTWAISGMQTVVPDASQRSITLKRIYRTVPGQNSSLFFFIDEIPVGDATYNDDVTDDEAALNNVLESTNFAEPLSDLEGFVVMPGGYLVGWKGRRLVFSEPYRPHAWPAEYELATEFEIVGLVVWGATLIIGTRSNPYIGQGTTPAAFTMQKMDAVEPCLSRRGMVATVVGAYYPSSNGLALVNTSGLQIITRDILTKDEWHTRYSPENLYAAQFGLQYIAFVNSSFGLVFNPTEPQTKLIELDRFSGVEGIETDRYTGDVYLLYQDRAWEWNPIDTERLYWRWRSKKFHLPKHVNFGAVKLKFDTSEEEVSDEALAPYRDYNEARFAAGPLGTIGGHVIGGVQGVGEVAGWTEPENRMPTGGSPLYPITFMSLLTPSIRFIAYADDVKVFDTVVRDENIVRMPIGFKRDLWQFEFIGNTTLYSAQIAETGRELAKL